MFWAKNEFQSLTKLTSNNFITLRAQIYLGDIFNTFLIINLKNGRNDL